MQQAMDQATSHSSSTPTAQAAGPSSSITTSGGTTASAQHSASRRSVSVAMKASLPRGGTVGGLAFRALAYGTALAVGTFAVAGTAVVLATGIRSVCALTHLPSSRRQHRLATPHTVAARPALLHSQPQDASDFLSAALPAWTDTARHKVGQWASGASATLQAAGRGATTTSTSHVHTPASAAQQNAALWREVSDSITAADGARAEADQSAAWAAMTPAERFKAKHAAASSSATKPGTSSQRELAMLESLGDALDEEEAEFQAAQAQREQRIQKWRRQLGIDR